jgi:hypothetical protein
MTFHVDSGWSCCSGFHFDGDDRECIKCANCGEWVRPNDMDIPTCLGRPREGIWMTSIFPGQPTTEERLDKPDNGDLGYPRVPIC